MSAANGSEPVAGDWDEAHLVEALAALEQLQDQLDELRSVVPNLTAPFLVPQSSPEALAQDFKRTAVGEATRLQAFERRWRSEQVQDILVHAAQSAKADPDLAKGAAVPRYGWVEMAEKQQRPSKFEAVISRANADDKTGASSISPAVAAFKSAHPKFQVDVDDGRVVTISFRVPSLVLTFVVTCHVDPDDKASFIVECPGNGPLFSAITRCISSRPRPHDLTYLLDMIAAYTDTRIARCAKCERLLDDTALSPAARRSKQTTAADGTKKTTWEPFHEGCL